MSKSTKHINRDNYYCYDDEYDEDLIPRPYMKPEISRTILTRKDNPVVFLELATAGGRSVGNGAVTAPQNLGRLYFELRKDLLPVACQNFLALVMGTRGYGRDGIYYHYKGNRIHRIIKNLMFQAGDLLDEKGSCSKSIFDGGLFRDENFILRHTGPGCISYCNRGPDTNGSLFQVTFTQNSDLDDRFVVFGCLTTDQSYRVLETINFYGTANGNPLEEVRIVDCGCVYPDPSKFKQNDL